MKKHPVLFSVILCLLCIAVTFVACSALFVGRFGGSDAFRDALKFAEARAVLTQYFVDDLDADLLTDASLDAMVAATEDRWSYYMNAQEFQAYLEYSANQYTGIGITVAPDEEGRGLIIREVLSDSPAGRAGIEVGMLMLQVNDTDMTGKTASDARDAILAAGESDIRLVMEDAQGIRKSFTIRTEILKVEVVVSEMLDEGVGYVRIANFEDGSAEAAIAALDQLLADGAKGIVFDVRNNPGGQLNELVRLLDYILPEGTLFISQNKDGKEVQRYSAADCVECPMAVLVNADSYSAAEFFAAALSEYDWAGIIGERTTGKARSQINVGLFDGSVLHISTARYLTPKRVDLSETEGLTPDVIVALGEDGDTQLDAAVRYLLEQH